MPYRTATVLDPVGDSTSRIGTFRTGNGNSTAGDFRDSVGLVTQFNVTPVPEPSSLALTGVGAIGLLAWR